MGFFYLIFCFGLFGCLSLLFSQSGCKFSLEEERVVIELQEQFGNKWAKIASYLPGRTDNDVKNFWSSRQKRMARIQKTSATTSKSQKNKAKVPTFLDVPTLEVNRKVPLFLGSFFFNKHDKQNRVENLPNT